MLVVGMIQAQELNTPAPSPMATVTQMVGLTEVSISYSRPGVKGRDIFGGLVPYDKIWRTGANKSTTITFSDDVKIQGMDVPAGEYALFSVPGKGEWTIIFSKNIGWGTNDYKKEGDVARFNVKPVRLPDSVEQLTIEIADITDSAARFIIRWANTEVAFGMTVDTDSKVMSQISEIMKDKTLSNPDIFYKAADYYFSTDKDLKQALIWAERAVELKPEAFWMIRLKSQIQAGMGDYEGAIKTAEESLELAEKAGYEAYIKFNRDAIAAWEKEL